MVVGTAEQLVQIFSKNFSGGSSGQQRRHPLGPLGVLVLDDVTHLTQLDHFQPLMVLLQDKVHAYGQS